MFKPLVSLIERMMDDGKAGGACQRDAGRMSDRAPPSSPPPPVYKGPVFPRGRFGSLARPGGSPLRAIPDRSETSGRMRGKSARDF